MSKPPKGGYNRHNMSEVSTVMNTGSDRQSKSIISGGSSNYSVMTKEELISQNKKLKFKATSLEIKVLDLNNKIKKFKKENDDLRQERDVLRNTNAVPKNFKTKSSSSPNDHQNSDAEVIELKNHLFKVTRDCNQLTEELAKSMEECNSKDL